MAVPKRRMSRSNTRSRRSQWKTTAPHPHHLPEPCVRREDAAPRCVPVVRHLQGPSGYRSGLVC
ncbi:50S ribosomal protein L32 [Rhodococcus hoagii]|nr:50S ribosomal protein L32 [Prescottella equi]